MHYLPSRVCFSLRAVVLSCALGTLLVMLPRRLPQLSAAEEDEASDVADVPSLDLRAGGNESMRYFLIGAPEETKKTESPKEGHKLLLVLPGGDGGAEANPFIRRIWKKALGEGHVVAQLVAPRWADEQAKELVWPTRKNPWKGMKFSTEEFIHAVIADVGKRLKVDSAHVSILAWSSGGPAAYAYSLTPGAAARRAFIAMSVFKPAELPDLRGARGNAYFILHSPQDFIPIRMAESARDELAKVGAATKLETYPGGHGWRGDVFRTIRKGVEWLEEQPVGRAAARKR